MACVVDLSVLSRIGERIHWAWNEGKSEVRIENRLKQARSEAMKSKTRKILLGAATVAALSAVNVTQNEAEAATVGLKMTAIILAPIAIASVSPLHFGTATVGATAGIIKITTAGARSQTGSVTLVTGAAAEQEGVFSITAKKALAFSVTAPTKATVTSAANKMTVNDFRFGDALGVGSATKMTAATNTVSAAVNYNLGGTLNVGAAQAPGTYTGTVTLTANYE